MDSGIPTLLQVLCCLVQDGAGARLAQAWGSWQVLDLLSSCHGAEAGVEVGFGALTSAVQPLDTHKSFPISLLSCSTVHWQEKSCEVWVQK